MTFPHFIIIGGMGPQASLALHERLLSAHEKPEEYPMITHFSLPIPDFVTHSDQIASALALINESTRLASCAQATAIGIACNTAHLLSDRIHACKGDNFVSMIDAATDTVVQQKRKRVGLIASPMTMANRLYHDRLEGEGIQVIMPESQDIPEIAAAIRHVLAGRNPHEMRPFLNSLAQKLLVQGADCILLGCTELPLIGINSTLPVIDSLSCLANAMHRRQTEVY